MKRVISLCICMLLALTACRAAPEEADTGLDSIRGFAHYAGSEVCATEDTIYYMAGMGGQLVYYYEKASGVGGVLCGKPECEHSAGNDSGCNAFIGSISSDLCVYNNRLYWIGYPSNICSMALDGTDHRTERVMGRDGIFSNRHRVMSAILHRGYAYILALNYKIQDGMETGFLELSAVPLDPDGEVRQLFSEELDTFAISRVPNVVMQAYGDWLCVLSSIARNYAGAVDGDIDYYDFKIRRYDAVTQELSTLYHDGESQLNYPVELWVTDDGIVFMGNDESSRYILRFDFESGGLTPLFDSTVGMTRIAEDLVVRYTYESERSNPTNPWGLTLAPQDEERSGDLTVEIRNFAGDVLVDGAYPLAGHYRSPDFCGSDDTYAYFLDSTLFNAPDGNTTYSSLLGVALDGSGMRVLHAWEEHFPKDGGGSITEGRTLDDGTTVFVTNNIITITPGDGGETVTITVEELLENGWQP